MAQLHPTAVHPRGQLSIPRPRGTSDATAHQCVGLLPPDFLQCRLQVQGSHRRAVSKRPSPPWRRENWVPRVVRTRLFTHALYTYSRAQPGAPKPPQLGSGSGGTSQAAVVSRLDDQPPSGPRARAFPGLAAHRGMSMAGGASSTELPRYSQALPLDSHRNEVPPQRPMGSCHPRSAAWCQAALWTRGGGEWQHQHLCRRRETTWSGTASPA